MALIGNTVRLKGQFIDFDDEIVEASNVKFIIYDKSGTIDEVEVATPNDNLEYVANYVIPDGAGSIYVKLYGEVDDYPEIGVISIMRE